MVTLRTCQACSRKRSWKLHASVLIQEPKGLTKPQKNRTNSTKEFSEQFEGLPVIAQQNNGLKANHTRKFTRTIGKTFVTQFLCGTFCPRLIGPLSFHEDSHESTHMRISAVLEGIPTVLTSECAKGAAKASCGETVVQKGFFGESVSSLPPQGLFLKYLKGSENHKGEEE